MIVRDIDIRKLCLIILFSTLVSIGKAQDDSVIVAVDSVDTRFDTLIAQQFKLYERPYYGTNSFKPLSRSRFLLLPKYQPEFILDKSGQFMNINNKIQNLDYLPPVRIPYNEFKINQFKALERDYWSSINLEKEQKEGQLLEKPSILPRIPLGALKTIFGGDYFDIKANVTGSFKLGGTISRIDNPTLPINQRRNRFTPQPDFQFKAGVEGKIGQRLDLGFAFDSKPYTLLTQTNVKLDYGLPDHTIFQKIELFNSSFSPSNSLIPGTQNLLGSKIRFRLGNLHIQALAGLKRGRGQVAYFRQGANIQEINIKADKYLYNHYFFLGHFFRNNYEPSLQNLPIVSSNVQITRLEVYITNRTNNTQDLRNIACFLDLGEVIPFNSRWQPNPDPANSNANDNSRNNLFSELQNVNRNLQSIKNDLQNKNLVEGTDFEVLTAARKLKPNEYYFNTRLGFIGLRQPISDDEVIAVAFEYTFNGQRFQVGELTENYQSLDNDEAIFLKMIRPSSIQIDIPTWDLMMKNVYNLEISQINEEGFRLQVIYRDDATGQDRPIITEGVNTKNRPLIQLLNADQLNSKLDPQPDGNFDFIEGLTIQSQYGVLIFPALEPFGSSLRQLFTENEQSLVNRYVFDELYDETQNDARQNTTKNKFVLVGRIQGQPSNVLHIQALHIAENSVIVRIGNTTLVENRDYTVNYLAKTVTINNLGLLRSNEIIAVEYEQGDVFSVRNRILFGFEAVYNLTKEISFSGTFLHLSERPSINTTRVTIGNEPTKNTIFGLKGNYVSESLLLTRIIDRLPLLSTKAVSKFNIQAEAAHLVPGLGNLSRRAKGISYIDDFETTEMIIPLSGLTSWQHGSTPTSFLEQVPSNLRNDLPSNYNRAKISWYTIDGSFYQNISGITVSSRDNHYDRQIPFSEIFPLRSLNNSLNIIRQQTFDIAFYPSERGVYNYNPNLNADGSLPDPENNFGALTFGITGDNVDFDKQNIQYIEFWFLDPFLQGENGLVEDQANTTGGSVFFNLGNISEDFIPDGQHFFENGLNQEPIPSNSIWGRVPTQPFVTSGFGTQPRNQQDLGFDGLNDEEEVVFFQQSFIDRLSIQNQQIILDDPSADNFVHFNDDLLADEERIVRRYKGFKGVENNSVENSVLSSTTLPNNEDINNDNTINTIESYFEYRLDLKPNMEVGDKYIVNKIESEVDGEIVTWYQVRIPIRDNQRGVINNLNSFKNMRFIRMYLTGWRQPVVLRMINFQLGGTFWREHEESLLTPGLALGTDNFGNTNFTISTVNIEENGGNRGENMIPYNLPPGFSRDPDPNSVTTLGINNLKNEQSLQLDIQDLAYNDARAVFRNLFIDFINYGRLRLEIHAHSLDAKDGDFTAFIRIGTDPNENYYEIAVPLTLTPFNTVFEEQERIWPENNQINISFDEFFRVKSVRNKQNFSQVLPFSVPIDKYTVTIKGKPDLSAAQVIILGVRNQAEDNSEHDITVWFNELRVSDFSRQGGGTVKASTNIQLADFANINANINYVGNGYAGVQSRPNERQRSNQLRYEVNAGVNLHKLGLEKIGINLPVYVSYSKTTISPFFDPQDRDVPLNVALEVLPEEEQNDYQNNAQTESIKRSINIPNLSKTKKSDAKKYIWDFENFSFNASYSDERRTDSVIQSYYNQNIQGGSTYNFKFKQIVFEPFKKKKKKDDEEIKGKNVRQPPKSNSKGIFDFIKNFNISLLPDNLMVAGGISRQYEEIFYRGDNLAEGNIFLEPLFRKQFTFDRTYRLSWNLMKSIQVAYNAVTNAVVDEPFGALDTQKKRDTVWQNLGNLGRIKNFVQNTKASYKVPLNTFPLLDFINNPSISYNFDYQWQSARLGQEDIFGHTIQNARSIDFGTGIKFSTIYNKSKWLKSITTQNIYRDKKKPNYQTSPINQKIARLNSKSQELTNKSVVFQKKIQALEADYQEKIRAIDSLPNKNQLLQKINTHFKKKRNKIQIKRQALVKKQQAIRASIRKYSTELTEMRTNKQLPSNQTFLKLFFRTLTGLKSIGFKYSQKEGTVLPGYALRPKFLGFDETWQAPGLEFILSDQSRNILLKARENNWLVRNNRQILPFKQTQQERITVSIELDILNDLTIKANLEKRRGATYTEVFRYDSINNSFISQSPFRKGNYMVSYGLYNNFFNSKSSEAFLTDFINYLPIIRQRRIESHPQNIEYDIIAQDVLVPAFIATYTQKDPNIITLNNFVRIPLPNWTLNYAGLGKIPAVKLLFKSVSLSHSYKSSFGIGDYSSSLLYLAESINLGLRESDFGFPVLNDSTEQIVPVIILNALVINEQFAPLIRMNLTTINDLKFNLKYGKGRTLTLNLNNAQITEVNNKDYSIGFSFMKKNLILPFRIKGQRPILPNLLSFNFGVTIRDTETIQHARQDGVFVSTVTNGTLNVQTRSNLNYQFIPKTGSGFMLDGGLYFERTTSKPSIQNINYPRFNTSFGIQVKATFTQ